MKKWLKLEGLLVLFGSICIVFESCHENKNQEGIGDMAMNKTAVKPISKKPLSKEFKDYWYAGNAEVTSYALEQAHYGELREGKAVLIYVTEPFVADLQVKADQNDPTNIPVLKLNSTKKYLTGIYPYSIMNSSFYPVHDNQHALKVTFSSQDWCGHVFTQLNNREKFNIKSFSYFENEGDKDFMLEKNLLENELWNKIRINPSALPLGNFEMIPSFEFLRVSHKELKPYPVSASVDTSESITTYKITYPTLQRTLEINFNSDFPFSIESWSDSFTSGYGDNARTMVSKASKIKTIKTPYWRQNGNNSLSLRDTLGL
ncbi:septum formation inhibitor Maf [Maribacter arenosus]|uniref:Septum formation inhibitor Maf n=1 Tax=Maribacter arenosus TaxID=1854708 RepID=A0ABR7V6P0_9FLAO|nr:septum formation inhibitor Maf [Maribacter arenosus]MBD0849356.1 septum formation inhibitor Maf [Maribacter arenosus]